jgi:O-succinylbenzoic acid--CoA ligase
VTTLLPAWLNQRAQATPDRLALVAGPDRFTFRELAARVEQTARRLGAFGVRKDDRVALLMRNGACFVELIHAVSRLGAVLVPLNTRLVPAEIAWQLADVQATHLIYDPPDAETARAAARDLPGLRLATSADYPTGGETALAQLPEADCPLQDDVDLGAAHSIIYTSGTTGKPKGAVLTFGNHWWSAMASALNLGVQAEDRWLACLPLFHVGGLAIVLRGVIYGNAIIVHEAFDPVVVNRAIDNEGVTMVSVVSAMLRRMIEARAGRPYPSSLRCVLLGGGPAPRPLLESCAELGVPVMQTYGLTETASQFATLSPEDASRKIGSAGKPLFPNRLRIETDHGAASPGEVGEIVVHGPTVTSGYVGSGSVAAPAQDGWFHTGDLGYVDEEGYLYVVARRDDLIISGGENIYPAEVEAVLLSHPDVEEAAVTGIPDARWGQVPIAAVKLRPDSTLTADELRAFCTARLGRYKVPVAFRFVDTLPRNAAGKLLRAALSEGWPLDGAR